MADDKETEQDQTIPTSKVAGAGEPLELIYARNHFYRDNYRRVLGALLLSVLVIIALTITLIYQVSHPPAPVYFAVREDGRMQQLVPLNQPNISQYALLQWAQQAAIAAYSYNFVDYRKQLQAASEFFTPEGWSNFIRNLNESNNLTTLRQKKLISSAVATGAPVVLYRGIVNNRYLWRVQMPVLVTYQSPSELIPQNLVITMVIERVSTLNSPQGIGIKSFVAVEEGTGGLTG